MNITDMITSLSEETIITGAIFLGAGFIYVLRKFSFLNQRITDYELADTLGRESLEIDLLKMNELIDGIRFEFEETRDSVEEELVQHELLGLNMAPRFQDLSTQITDTLDEQSDSIIDVNRNIDAISSMLSHLSNGNDESQFKQFNSLIPKMVSQLEQVDNSVKQECSRVSALVHDVNMMKNLLGVE